MAEIERQREAELIREAEHARDGITAPTRPTPPGLRPVEEIEIPRRLLGRPPVPVPLETGHRHPNSLICQLARLWEEGKL